MAVSGGADSVCLLAVLQDLVADLRLTLSVAHFDHALRESSAADSDWVVRLGQRLDLPVITERRMSSASGGGIEEQARFDRYQFLQRTAQARACHWVALGHTANDQAETVLHHVLRGTGLTGLAGIPETRPLNTGVTLVRPLLNVQRIEIERWLRAREIQWRTDDTNADESFTRNWLRQTLLPILKAELNPQVDRALIQLASQARDSVTALTWMAAQLTARHLEVERRHSEVVAHIDCTPLRDVPAALLSTFFVELWKELNWPRKKMAQSHWFALVDLVRHQGHPTGHDFPEGLRARWRRGRLSIGRHLQD